MSRLGETIRAARVQAGMTEKALAKKCGMTESVIKDMENGRRIPTDDQTRRILKLLGATSPVSTELDAAHEPDVPVRPRPKPYVLPAREEDTTATTAAVEAFDGPADAWRDALGGVVKRVPITGEDSLVIDHELTPIVMGKIEGGQPDKVFYFRMDDNSLSGYRVFAGDLLLTVPGTSVERDSIMVLQYQGRRIARKVLALDGGKLLLQSYDREFRSETILRKDALLIGKCVKLVRRL